MNICLVLQNNLPWVYGLAFNLLIIAVGYLEVRNSRKQNRPSQKEYESTYKHIVPRRPYPNDEEHRSSEEAYWVWYIKAQKVATWINVFVVVFAAAAALGVWQTYIETRRQASAAVDTLELTRASSRPYIIPQIVKDELTINKLTEGSGENLPIVSYEAIIHFTNFGTTPASIKSIEHYVTSALPLRGPPLVKYFVTSLVLAKDGSTPQETWSVQATQNEYQRLVTLGGTIFVSGKIVFSEVTGREHHYSFCYGWPTGGRVNNRRLTLSSDPGCENSSD